MITIKAKKHICNILIFTGFIIIILGIVEFLVVKSPVLIIVGTPILLISTIEMNRLESLNKQQKIEKTR